MTRHGAEAAELYQLGLRRGDGFIACGERCLEVFDVVVMSRETLRELADQHVVRQRQRAQGFERAGRGIKRAGRRCKRIGFDLQRRRFATQSVRLRGDVAERLETLPQLLGIDDGRRIGLFRGEIVKLAPQPCVTCLGVGDRLFGLLAPRDQITRLRQRRISRQPFQKSGVGRQ
ncbi:MAG: hypothetical protein J0H32_13405 [Rhizobiales bacterium]|nr:hypothetical protein [Hyphomicrobiales bacterium]